MQNIVSISNKNDNVYYNHHHQQQQHNLQQQHQQQQQQQHNLQQQHQQQQQHLNVIFIDSRSHLEVADKKHRYSKHLRFYYKEYDNIIKSKSNNNNNNNNSNNNNNKEGTIINSNSGNTHHLGSYNNYNNDINNKCDNNNKYDDNNKWIRYEPFFEWLDNCMELPNLKECPRSILDSDRVLYITNNQVSILICFYPFIYSSSFHVQY